MTTAVPTHTSRVRLRYDPEEAFPPEGSLTPRSTPDASARSGAATTAPGAARPRVLHVGCGGRSPARLHRIFRTRAWHEVRLDIDPAVEPDVVASIIDLRAVATASCDAIWCSHNLEHLCAHEVATALGEFRRVLAPTGFVLIRSPDLGAVAEIILAHGLDHVVYRAPAGPITAADMLYGHAASIAQGNAFMRHGTGFTSERLARLLDEAGFARPRTARTADYTVWAAGFMPNADVARILRALRRTGLTLSGATATGVTR